MHRFTAYIDAGSDDYLNMQFIIEFEITVKTPLISNNTKALSFENVFNITIAQKSALIPINIYK